MSIYNPPQSSGGGTPGGSPTNIQYNDSGTFGGLTGTSVDATNGFLGLGAVTPVAFVHTGIGSTLTVAAPTSPASSINAGVSGGYAFGSGNKVYNIFSKATTNGNDYYSAASVSTTFTEPSSADYDPNTLGVFINYAESGYIASSYTFQYQVWAIYPNSMISIGTVQSSPATDDNSGNPFALDVSWANPPAGAPVNGFLVQSITGPNTGLSRIIYGTSFIDDNTSWSTFGGFTSLLYGVDVSFTAATGASDYVVQNATNSTHTLTGGATTISDIGSWTSGMPTVLPTSYTAASIISEGITELVKTSGSFGVFGSGPVIQQSGNALDALSAYGWVMSPFVAGGDVKYSSGAPVISSLDILFPDNTTFANGSTKIVNAASGLITGSSTGVTNAGLGTLQQLKLVAGNTGSTDGTITYNSDRPQIYITAAGGNYQIFTYADVLGPTFGGTGSVGVSQGDLLYGVSSSAYARLAKNTTATRYLSNTGTSNNPAWAQINLANGVTGTLPVANGGTGQTTLLAAGIVKVVASGRATAQTAANTNILTYATPATDGSYEISGNVLVTTATLHSFTMTVDYTDEGNTARTLTMNFSTIAGVLTPTIANAGGALPYEGVPLHIRTKASTNIVFKTAGTFTTVTYNVEGIIRQIN